MLLKWGVASTGKIANDFVVATKVLPDCKHSVVAVAARSGASAEIFAKMHSIPVAYEGYHKLADDQDVQVVYVAVLNPQHFEVSKMMLEKGKHVLCEKPLTTNQQLTRELVALAREKNLFLMEAVWSRCFPVYRELRKVIQSGEIGEIKQVTAEFGVPIQTQERIKKKSLGGGVILDLCVYTLQFQQYVFRGMKPVKVVANGHLTEEGVDSCVGAIITYPCQKMAVLCASGNVQMSNKAYIYGTKGYVKINDMWCPTTIEINGRIDEFPLIENEGTFNYHNSAGLAYEAEEVRQCIKKGMIESSQITHEETIQLAQFMDKLRADVGVVFPNDPRYPVKDERPLEDIAGAYCR